MFNKCEVLMLLQLCFLGIPPTQAHALLYATNVKSQCHPKCFARLCFCFEVWLARLARASAAMAFQQADIYSSSL